MHEARQWRPVGFLVVGFSTVITTAVALIGTAASWTGHWSTWWAIPLYWLVGLVVGVLMADVYWEHSWASKWWTLVAPFVVLAVCCALIAATGADFEQACHSWRTADACLR